MKCALKELNQEFHFYHREYNNDVLTSDQMSSLGVRERLATGLRFVKIALPYLALHQPSAQKLTLAMGCCRVLRGSATLMKALQTQSLANSAIKLLELTPSLLALAGALVAPSVGMIITTSHDSLIGMTQLISALRQGRRAKSLDTFIQLINNVLYLCLIATSNLEFMIACALFQMVYAAYQSRAEFLKGADHYLEAVGHLGMALIRGYQTSQLIHAAVQIRRIHQQEGGKKPVPNPEPNTGLVYQITREGHGKAAGQGDQVSIHYTGTLENGVKFDSSLDRGASFTFTLGSGCVIQGWEEGILGMTVGERRTLIIPASLAYGSSGLSGIIPPNATLYFDVELMEIKN